MGNVCWHEIAFGLLMIIIGCKATKQYAINGIYELSIQNPPNVDFKRAFRSGFVAIVIYGIYLVIINYVPNVTFLIICVFSVPFIFGVIYRYFIMPPGLAEYMRASHKTFHWRKSYYIAGVRESSPAQYLGQDPLVQVAIDQFNQSVKLQEEIATDRGRINIATIYQEMSLLYRMIDKLDDAKEVALKGEKIAQSLCSKFPGNIECLALHEVLIFRIAEVYHLQGNKIEALNYYRQSLDMCYIVNNQDDIVLIKRLISELT